MKKNQSLGNFLPKCFRHSLQRGIRVRLREMCRFYVATCGMECSNRAPVLIEGCFVVRNW